MLRGFWGHIMELVTPDISTKQKIVIVGGGAGGLELATRLGKILGKKKKAEILLVDENLNHVWKPLLHEVAAESFDPAIDRINYFAHAAQHYYQYHPGQMINLCRKNKEVILAAFVDENQQEIIPPRTLKYDTLIFAVGSKGNYFRTPGASQYCLTLDNLDQANLFQNRFINKIFSINYSQKTSSTPFNIIIVGAGATGVELAAELHRSLVEMHLYGLKNEALSRTQITLIESSKRILSGLPQQLAESVSKKLHELNIHLLTDEKVTQVQADGIHTQSGKFIPADLCVWAAGIKAPQFLKNLDGLQTDAVNRLVVHPNLQTTYDKNIFALGDCAHLVDPKTGLLVPARAQAAHQQALFLAHAFKKNYMNGTFKFHDRGSIIALASYSAYGNLTTFNKFQYYISGKIALFAYKSLYFFHLVILHGFWSAFWFKLTRTRLIKLKSRLKLHIGKS